MVRINSMAEPQPDWRNMEKTARNLWVEHIPLYEHQVNQGVMEKTLGCRPGDMYFSSEAAESAEGFRQYWEFWRRLGYDTASMEFLVTDILPGGGALGEHREGCIKTRQDFERYPWDELPGLYFDTFGHHIDTFAAACPAGMKAVGGVGNGVFECVEDLVGYMDLCYMRVDDPELYADLFKAMGELHSRIWARFLERYADIYCVMRFGDDLGYKAQTLLSTDDIVAHILPQYKRVVAQVHRAGKPFLLHSCGYLFTVMDELIDGVGIDAKHSNEDQIAHFTEWVDRYGDRIANFGGIDMDVLCRCSEREIRAYVLDCLEKVKGRGGIAFGSGNSIPDYVPYEGFLTMINTVREWRGDAL